METDRTSSLWQSSDLWPAVTTSTVLHSTDGELRRPVQLAAACGSGAISVFYRQVGDVARRPMAVSMAIAETQIQLQRRAERVPLVPLPAIGRASTRLLGFYGCVRI